MKTIEINGNKYKLENNVRDGFELKILEEKLTDYYNDFDYVVGDWAYGKLRLKGFYDSHNKKCKEFNDIKYLDDYINNNCAYGCKWFCISKITIEKK